MLRKVTIIIKLLLLPAIPAVIAVYRTSLASSIRGWLLLLIPIALLVELFLTIYLVSYGFKSHPSTWRQRLVLLTSLTLFALFGLVEGSYRLKERALLMSAAEDMSILGQHFVIGFSNYEQVKALVERGAIGGIYFSKKSVARRTVVQIRAQIDELQQMRRQRGELPLIICGDQEGGAVSHLSPPLKKRPFMAELAGRDEDIYHYGLDQGKELKALGVNLNFSPVVDLKVATLEDRLIRREPLFQIYYRAISRDPEEVSSGGLAYCRGLAANGVGSTLKHFPGLGRASSDSHLTAPPITTDLETLQREDWLPFRQIGSQKDLPLAIMVGHCIVEAVDPEQPASLSEPVVKGILREEWGFEGLIVTDDLSMYPISLSRGGVEEAALKALSNGTDYILISNDHELYYYAMSSLMKSYRRGRLDGHLLEQSKGRMRGFFAQLE